MKYFITIGASLSEPHINDTSSRFSIYYIYIYIYIYIIWYDRHPCATLGRTKIRKLPTCLHVPTSLSVLSQLLYLSTVAVSFDIGSLQYEFYKSSTRLCYKSATRLRSARAYIYCIQAIALCVHNYVNLCRLLLYAV